ncbi:MAG: site-specific recombinase [Sphingomonadales bacterium]|nr:site-specific recombinase [Sphingomonadales bacterium]
MRVALYARYSSEAQKDSSIEQQLRLLRDRVEAEGWEIAAVYEDKAFTGSNMMRPGLQKLLAASHEGLFETVLVESIDRLSRDQEDIAHMHKRFRHRGIAIISLMEGEISSLHVGLKGTMSMMYIEDLSRRTHRGLQQRALEGESAGGTCYGYDIERRHDARGERIGGIRHINEAQAQIVRRIFTDYCGGKSPKKIAFELNAEGIPGPRGGTWSASTIYGNRRRGTGLLLNELYVGRQIWGKQSYFKDPDTGRETGRLNDESTWVRAEVPHLRIIDDEVWERARALQKALAEKGDFTAQRRPRKLFSFLLKCGECGGGFAKIGATQYGCASARNKGTCSCRLTISERKLEEAVLGTLRKRLMRPDLCEVFCVEYTEHVNRLRRENNTALETNRAELERTERTISKLVDAIKNGIDPVLIRDEINGLQQRKLKLEASLEEKAEAPVFIHPNMAHRYNAEVQGLIASLNEPGKREEAAELIRSLISKIVLTPNEDRSALAIDLHGNLAGILRVSAGLDAEHSRKRSGGHAFAEESELHQIRLVAGSKHPQKSPDWGISGDTADWLGSHPTDSYDLAEATSRNRWLGRQDSNLRMPVPKTGALPLGDAPAEA